MSPHFFRLLNFDGKEERLEDKNGRLEEDGRMEPIPPIFHASNQVLPHFHLISLRGKARVLQALAVDRCKGRFPILWVRLSD